ncbi:sugar transporter ERD [Salix suchowensis]|nr:sugar transporter ERD [Salix suchowensis]
MAASTRSLLLDDGNPNVSDNGNSDEERSHDQSSITPILVVSTFIAVCGSFCYGFAVGYSSTAESGIRKELDLSVSEYSVFGSIMTIGGMVGAISSGKVADYTGRKRTMWLSEIFCISGWLVIAFAKDVWWLYIGRLSLGVGVGLITYVVPVYIAEITPKNHRGGFTSAQQLMLSLGFALIYFIGNIIYWRTLSLIVLIPCILQLVGLFFIPESPRWLAKLDREKEFETNLQWLRGMNADISQEAIDIRDTLDLSQHNSKAKFLNLFQRKYAYPIIVGVGLMLLQQFGGTSAVAYYSSSIYVKANFSTIIGTTTAGIMQIPASIAGVLLLDISGRRRLLLVSSIGTCLSLVLVGLSFLFQELHYLEEITPILTFIGLLGYGVTFAVGMSGIPWVIMSEIFPLDVKASAGSLVTFVNWSGSWIVTYSFSFMLDWSSTGTFFFFAAVCGVTALFIWKWVPETKGRTLEEIQAAITRFPSEVGYSSPAESGIMEDLGLSVSAYSFFGSIVTIGGMVGAILSGKMADLVGRRGTMWACQIICMAGWLAIAFAKKAWCLDVGRFLVGVAIGILTYVVPVYISEITPKNLRGRFTSANQLLVCCGFAVTYFVGSIVSWRALSLIATIPSILQIVCLFFVPESPRWLAKLGRQKEFEASLQRLRGAESDISEEAVDIRDAIEILKQTSAETRTLELFQRRYAYVIIVGEGLILLQTFGGNSAVSYYLGTIFAKASKFLLKIMDIKAAAD